jgi:inhibitor of Bruton tyrosine kinase
LESVNWTKVKDKKESVTKNKPTGVLAGLKANEILQSEGKLNDKFTKLSNVVKALPEKVVVESSSGVVPTTPTTTAWQTPKVDDAVDISERMMVCLGDFAWTPQKGKASAKQRKRLSSETQKSPAAVTNGANEKEEKEDKSNGNPWANNSLASLIKSPTETTRKSASISIPNRTNNNIASNNSYPKTPPSLSKNSFNFNNSFGSPKPGESISFSEILEDEIREKKYVEKVKSKSLILTQMEETAIEELKEFYNVDEVFDENIKIERKKGLKGLVNYAIWQIN